MNKQERAEKFSEELELIRKDTGCDFIITHRILCERTFGIVLHSKNTEDACVDHARNHRDMIRSILSEKNLSVELVPQEFIYEYLTDGDTKHRKLNRLFIKQQSAGEIFIIQDGEYAPTKEVCEKYLHHKRCCWAVTNSEGHPIVMASLEKRHRVAQGHATGFTSHVNDAVRSGAITDKREIPKIESQIK